MRTSKFLIGALVCLLGLGTVTSCGEKKPTAPTQQELEDLAAKLIKRVTVDSSAYLQATKDFALPVEVINESTSYPITWKSNKTDAAKIVTEKKEVEETKEDGTKVKVEKTFITCKVTRPAPFKDDIPFTLTATLKVGEIEKTKTFEGYVMRQEKPEEFENIAGIYTALESGKLMIKGKSAHVQAYIIHAAKDGYYVASSETDRNIYVYDPALADYKEKGYKIGDQLDITGPVATYSSYQFKLNDCLITKTDAASKVMTFPAPEKAYTPADLADLDTTNYYHPIYGTKWVIEGKVKVDNSGNYPSYYLETPTGEGKWKVKFDFKASEASVYDTLASKDGQTCKFEVYYYGQHEKQHKLGVLKDVTAA